MAQCADGMPLLTKGNIGSYLCAWPDEALLKEICKDFMLSAGIDCHDMPAYLRVRQRGEHLIFTYYGPDEVSIPLSFEGEFVLGGREMKQADVTIMKIAVSD